jgi:hypothetical protein
VFPSLLSGLIILSVHLNDARKQLLTATIGVCGGLIGETCIVVSHPDNLGRFNHIILPSSSRRTERAHHFDGLKRHWLYNGCGQIRPVVSFSMFNPSSMMRAEAGMGLLAHEVRGPSFREEDRLWATSLSRSAIDFLRIGEVATTGAPAASTWSTATESASTGTTVEGAARRASDDPAEMLDNAAEVEKALEDDSEGWCATVVGAVTSAGVVVVVDEVAKSARRDT